MKNNLVLLFFLALTVSVSAQSLPDRKETLEVMKKVNGYFMKKYADYTIPSFYGRVLRLRTKLRDEALCSCE